MTNPNDAFSWLTSAALGEQSQNPDEANAEMMAKNLEDQMIFARLVHSVFAEGAGLELLTWLEDHTIRAPLMQVTGSLVEGEVALSPADWAYVREGQNSIVRLFLGQIELAKNPPKIQEENQNEL